MERMYWEKCEKGIKKVQYGTDMPGSAFSRNIPSDSLGFSGWNLEVCVKGMSRMTTSDAQCTRVLLLVYYYYYYYCYSMLYLSVFVYHCSNIVIEKNKK